MAKFEKTFNKFEQFISPKYPDCHVLQVGCSLNGLLETNSQIIDITIIKDSIIGSFEEERDFLLRLQDDQLDGPYKVMRRIYCDTKNLTLNIRDEELNITISISINRISDLKSSMLLFEKNQSDRRFQLLGMYFKQLNRSNHLKKVNSSQKMNNVSYITLLLAFFNKLEPIPSDISAGQLLVLFLVFFSHVFDPSHYIVDALSYQVFVQRDQFLQQSSPS